jgi:hypothetical protein
MQEMFKGMLLTFQMEITVMTKAMNKAIISETQLHNKCGLIINNIDVGDLFSNAMS